MCTRIPLKCTTSTPPTFRFSPMTVRYSNSDNSRPVMFRTRHRYIYIRRSCSNNLLDEVMGRTEQGEGGKKARKKRKREERERSEENTALLELFIRQKKNYSYLRTLIFFSSRNNNQSTRCIYFEHEVEKETRTIFQGRCMASRETDRLSPVSLPSSKWRLEMGGPFGWWPFRA